MSKKTPESTAAPNETPSHQHEIQQTDHEKELLELLEEVLPLIEENLNYCIEYYLARLEELVHCYHDLGLKDQPVNLWLWRYWFFQKYEHLKQLNAWYDKVWEKNLDLRLSKIEAENGMISNSTINLLNRYIKIREFAFLAEQEVWKYYHDKFYQESTLKNMIEIISPKFLVNDKNKMQLLEEFDKTFPRPIHKHRWRFLYKYQLLGEDLRNQENVRYANITLAIGKVGDHTPASLVRRNFAHFKAALANKTTKYIAGDGWRHKPKEVSYDEMMEEKDNPEAHYEDFTSFLKDRAQKWKEAEINDVTPMYFCIRLLRQRTLMLKKENSLITYCGGLDHRT